MTYQAKVEEAVIHLLNGLHTDGAHHKQWDMEQALLSLVGKERVEEIKKAESEDDCYWEEGIPA